MSPSEALPLLSDRRGRALRDLRISVTDRCNLRCGYCMPAEIFGERYQFLPKPEILTFEEIERVAGLAVRLGARKLRITGGEPLLRAELPKLIARLAALPGVEDVALTTNGLLLARHAEALARAGLRRATVSLDSLDEEVFARMSGRGATVATVLEGIAAATRAGLAPLKINCVVQRDTNEHGLVDLVRHFRGTGAIVRFIEFMDVGTLNRWDHTKVVPAREIRDRIAAELPLLPLEPNYRGEVARRYALADGSGEIGIIASVTQPFCGDCTRARLSADGRLVTCLFASSGTDLKAPLRAGASDAELEQLVAGVWRQRSDRYSEERAEPLPGDAPAREKIQMYQIGG
jgi:cyclic pyranopterin phosphate synthase